MPDKTMDEMNSRSIEELLQSIRPEPGEHFYRRMERAPWQAVHVSRKGFFPMKLKTSLTIAVLTLLTATALIVTPAGSVLANEILHFFDRVQGNTLPLLPDQVVEMLPTATAEPTFALALQPAGQVVATTPTASATPDLAPGEDELDDLSLTQAEAALGMALYQPAHLPRDYRLTRIQYNAVSDATTLFYASPQAGSGEFFSLREGKAFESLTVGEGAQVETIAIGDADAELVRGGWFTANGAGEQSWESQSETYTLRWQAGETAISMVFSLNDAFAPAYLTRDEILAVARGLARCDEGDLACRLGQAAVATGFTPWVFSSEPAGLALAQVDYRPGTIDLLYGGGMDQLTVRQSSLDFTAQAESPWLSVPDGAVQAVSVAGQGGEYVRGQFMARPGESEAGWDADLPVERLRWKNDAGWFQVVRLGEPSLGAQPLAYLAAQLAADGSASQAPTTPAPTSGLPDVYTDLDALQAAAGFDVLEPAMLPAGLPFSHARILPDSGGVMLFYGDFAPDWLHANGPVLLITQGPRLAQAEPMDDLYPPEAHQAVEVAGYPGVATSGTLETFMSAAGQPTPAPTWHADSGSLALRWDTPAWSFSVGFNPTGHGDRLSLDDLLAIAASLH